jgi:phosphohistidine phosphatase
MSRELWLLRHGKSDRDVIVNDFDRPLKKRGIRAAQRIGIWMQQMELIPDIIISSPAERAIATSKIVCKAIAFNEEHIQQNISLYADGFESIKSVLKVIPQKNKKILLVGHNPELEDLLIHLVGKTNIPEVKKLIPTAAFVRLTMPTKWTDLLSGCAQLVSITHPKSLSEGGL